MNFVVFSWTVETKPELWGILYFYETNILLLLLSSENYDHFRQEEEIDFEEEEITHYQTNFYNPYLKLWRTLLFV